MIGLDRNRGSYSHCEVEKHHHNEAADHVAASDFDHHMLFEAESGNFGVSFPVPCRKKVREE
jgi:hypothetical protein